MQEAIKHALLGAATALALATVWGVLGYEAYAVVTSL